MNAAADADEKVLRLSLDAKATVKIGEFSRGGQSRVKVAAADHDFRPEATLTPFGIVVPKFGDLYLYLSASKITSDFIVDRLDEWWLAVRPRCPLVTTLALNLDNGPEHHSRRTQFIKRLIAFADRHQLTVRLIYYPPYHSKYNPIERCRGVLEKHWNGTLLDAIDTTLKFAATMTWKGKHPQVSLVTTVYATGVRLTQAAMKELETRLQRLPNLEKWFVDIVPVPRLNLVT